MKITETMTVVAGLMTIELRTSKAPGAAAPWPVDIRLCSSHHSRSLAFTLDAGENLTVALHLAITGALLDLETPGAYGFTTSDRALATEELVAVQDTLEYPVEMDW